MRLIEVSETQHALGGDASIGLIVPEGSSYQALFTELWRQTFHFEKSFSRFLPESELSRFNAQAGLKIPVSDEFAELLRAAQMLSVRTTGLFNPFVLPALQRTGYIHSAVAEYSEDVTPDFRSRSVVSPDKLELGDGWARIPYNTAIDLGGCGKGYLVNQLALYAREHGASGYWINLSGDIATYGHDVSGQPITVAVQSAEAEPHYIYTVTCPAEPFAIATSGTLARVTQASTLRGHHIIDPRTSQSAKTNVRLATVCASTGLDADVLASCAVIVGATEAPSLLASHGVNSWLLQVTTDEGIKYVTHGNAISKQKREIFHA